MLEELVARLVDLLKRIPKQYYFPLALGILGIIVFGYGLIQYMGATRTRENNYQAQDFTDEKNGNRENSIHTPSISTRKVIVIDISGAVITPGVYSVPFDSRVQDALVAAGGLAATADREYIAKQVNLAAKLGDGMKIYIPSKGEIVQTNTHGDSSVLGAQAGSININSASADELDSLPGVGAVTAAKIINNRPYTDLTELVTKKVITQKVFDKIKDTIRAF